MRYPTGKWFAVATATAVVSGVLISGSPAIAAEAAPSVATHALSTQQQARAVNATVSGATAVPAGVGTKGHICLKNASSYCIKTNGAGNQVTVTNDSANYANFTVVSKETSGSYVFYEWEDGNGNCLREGTHNIVKIESGSCAALGDNTDTWELYASHVVINDYYGDSMLVRGEPRDGFKVFAYSGTSKGDFYQWNVPA